MTQCQTHMVQHQQHQTSQEQHGGAAVIVLFADHTPPHAFVVKVSHAVSRLKQPWENWLSAPFAETSLFCLAETSLHKNKKRQANNNTGENWKVDTGDCPPAGTAQSFKLLENQGLGEFCVLRFSERPRLHCFPHVSKSFLNGCGIPSFNCILGRLLMFTSP